MKTATYLSAVSLLACAAVAPSAFACNAQPVSVLCQTDCRLRVANDPYTLQTALLAAQRANTCRGELITVWSYRNHPGGVGETFHWIEVAASPVSNVTQLEDNGWEIDNEQTVIPPLSQNSEGGWWFEEASTLSGSGPTVVLCANSFCK